MLFLSMLPIYIFGNLHCIGMCGPLVMMIGKHRYRYFYFLGRTLSFTLAGLAAGGMGAVLNVALQEYHVPAITSFLFGIIILAVGIASISAIRIPVPVWVLHRTANLSRSLSFLMLKDQPLATFLFGLFTIALPCGQTIIVYSACAISGDPYIGMLNGFLFALFTSPSLFLAMRAHGLLQAAKKHYALIMGCAAIFVGLLAVCRGAAELDIIPHLTLNPNSPQQYHLVIY
jgi:sulfite exporter TauE/SafE